MWEYNYDSLQHYASPYYDPQKAHEYYEQHKKLKGRKSSTSLTDTGKEAAGYVKSQIDEEKNAKLEAEQQRHEKAMQVLSDAQSRNMEQHRTIMNQRITSLRNMLKRMPEAQKASEAPKIKALIYKLREDNDKKRADIKAKYKKDTYAESQSTAETKKQIRNEYQQKYEEEYEKIAGSMSKPNNKRR